MFIRRRGVSAAVVAGDIVSMTPRCCFTLPKVGYAILENMLGKTLVKLLFVLYLPTEHVGYVPTKTFQRKPSQRNFVNHQIR